MVSIMRLKRIKREKSQIDIDRETDIPQYRISLIERGVLASADERKRISEALGCREDEIFSQGKARFDLATDKEKISMDGKF